MIQLTRGVINTVSSTLRDNDLSGSADSKFYLFEFTSEFSEAKVYLHPTIITDTYRGTSYTLDLTSDPLTFGQFEVTVYRQTDNVNEDPEDASVNGICFEDKAWIALGSTDTQTITYTPTLLDSISYVG